MRMWAIMRTCRATLISTPLGRHTPIAGPVRLMGHAGLTTMDEPPAVTGRKLAKGY